MSSDPTEQPTPHQPEAEAQLIHIPPGKPSDPLSGASGYVGALDFFRVALTFFIVKLRQAQQDGSIEVQRAAFFSFGWVFVDYFFCLSGFALTLVYLPRFRVATWPAFGAEYLRFVLTRLACLYPLHALFSLLAFALGECAAPLLLRDLLLGIAFYDTTSVSACNGPNWFVHYELYLCLLAPFIFAAAHRSRLALPAAAVFVLALLTAALTLNRPGPEASVWTVLTFRAPFPFLTGFLVAVLFARAPSRPRPFDVLALATLLALVFHFSRPFALDDRSFLPPAYLLFPVLLYAAVRSPVTHFLADSRPIRLLSALSFAIYLAHHLVVFKTGPLFDNLQPLAFQHHTAFAYLKYLLTLPLAALVHFIVEIPCILAVRFKIRAIGQSAESAQT